MEINFLELWARMGMPVRGVVIVLTLQALACVTVIIDRLVVLLQSGAKARAYAEGLQPALETRQYDKAITLANEYKGSHLASYLALGLRTFTTRVSAGDAVSRAAELARRALERRGDAISRELNRGMNVLASTGSTAPFVGLLGTVLGIINAFKLIAAEGSGGIGTIGSAIGEALVVTGYGLVVAIPSVLIFNYLSGRIANYEAGLVNAGSELLDQLEISAQAERSSSESPESRPAPMTSTTAPASAMG
jgi:biopolymer transport protein ExbB/TolQ